MKTIKQPSYFNSRINHRITFILALLSCITLTFIMLTLLMSKAHAEEPYRFDRLWPRLAQPWYFSEPNDVAISPNGLVYVADTDFNRIQVFSADGVFIRSWGRKGSGEAEFDAPQGIAVSGNLVYVSDSGNDRIQVIDAEEGTFIDTWGSKGSGTDELDAPQGIAVSDGLVYVADSGNARIQVIATDVGFISNWGRSGSGNGEFGIPQGIAVSGGLVYVADSGNAQDDSGNARIQIFDAEGNFMFTWQSKGPGDDEFDSPQGIAVNGDFVYVADGRNHRIQVFTAEGEFIRTWGRAGSEKGEFNFPTGVAVSGDSVYVADASNDRIQVFNAKGKFIRSWGRAGSEKGEFNFPTEIAVSGNLVYVADSGNKRIQIFTAEGDFIRTLRRDRLGEGEFSFPAGIAVSASGLVSVSDGENNRIQVFDIAGEFLESISLKGSDPGQLNFPSAVAFNSEGALFVADIGNNRIQKFVRGERPIMKKLRKAIILAGGGPSKGSYSNQIWNETEILSKKARRALKRQDFQKGEIKFLTAGNTKSDLDGNGKLDDLEYASLNNLEQAITQWAVDADNVVIYLIDHGGPGIFAINDKETLKEAELTAWVNILNEKIPGKVTLIIEACKSASFLKPLANKNKRINLISSTNADQPNTVSNGGFNSFSFFFWSAINFDNDLQKAYRAGKLGIKRPRINGEQEIPQDPHLDSDGDQQFNTDDDFTTLADFCLGKCTDFSPTPPTIVNPTAPTELNGATVATLSMRVKSKEPILRAWVVIKPPDFKHPNSNEPISDLPEFALECDDNKLCTTSLDTFNVNGKYVITYFVLDTKLQLAPPKPIILTQKQGMPINECTLDADGSGSFDALTDGLLSIRYMFGIRGDSLIKDAVANVCTTCSVAEIETILEQCGSAGTSDIDGNGQVDALTDGLLIIRYLFGLRGDSLINGSVANNCSRCTAPEIEAYMQGLMP
jgi:DNA-binding beta-propeller fold protein YncE